MDTSVDPVKEAEYKELVRRIALRAVAAYPSARVYLFGSRVTGPLRRSSDFDIGISGVPKEQFWKVKQEIEEGVEESRVPHSVDVVNLDAVEAWFLRSLEGKVEAWKEE